MSECKPPSDGKISYKWIESTIEAVINPYGEDMLKDVVGQVIFHLQHLHLIREDRIEFDANDVTNAKP